MINDQFSDSYKLFWRKKSEKFIAEVRNYATDGVSYRRIKINRDDKQLRKLNMRFLVTGWGDAGPEILVSSEFLKLPRLFMEAAIWHEVGHVHYEHHTKTAEKGVIGQEELRNTRISHIRAGKILPEELEADVFAIERVGEKAMIKFLSVLIESRPTGPGQSWNDLGRRELELRIKHIDELLKVSCSVKNVE